MTDLLFHQQCQAHRSLHTTLHSQTPLQSSHSQCGTYLQQRTRLQKNKSDNKKKKNKEWKKMKPLYPRSFHHHLPAQGKGTRKPPLETSQYIYATDCILHTFTMAAFTWSFVFKRKEERQTKQKSNQLAPSCSFFCESASLLEL